MIRIRLFAGNNNRALTLIELIVTVTIVSIIAGITMASMKTVNRPQQLVENATNLVYNALTQANVNSLTTVSTSTATTSNAKDVCSLTYDPVSKYAICDTQTTWTNVNGNKLPNQVVDSISGATNNKVTYVLGLLPTGPTGSLTSNNIIITIALATKASCFNTITIWPNGVLDVNTQATIANC